MKHSRSAIWLVLLLASACVDSSEKPESRVRTSSSWCGLSHPSIWAGADIAGGASSSANIDSAFSQPAGLVVQEDTVYVLDLSVPEIVKLALDLRRLDAFGREGRGPGELVRGRITTGAPVPDLLATDGTDLVVVDRDGSRVQVMAPDGRMKRTAAHNVTLLGWNASMTPRLRTLGDTVVFGGGFFPSTPPSSRAHPLFQIRSVVRGTVSTQWVQPIAPLFGGRLGGTMGPDEALPIWDMAGECLFFNDGKRPFVLVFNRSTGVVDTIPFQIPRGVEIGYSLNSGVYHALGVDAPSGPKHKKHVTNLIVDPSGVIWIELAPTARFPTQRVVLLLERSGDVRVDTIPAFPQAFAANGTSYGIGFTSDGLGVAWAMTSRSQRSR